jgi:hypothetical protein
VDGVQLAALDTLQHRLARDAEGAHLPGGEGALLREQVAEGAAGRADREVGAAVLGQARRRARRQVGVGADAGELGRPFEEDFAAGAVDPLMSDGDAQEVGGVRGEDAAEDAADRVTVQ